MSVFLSSFSSWCVLDDKFGLPYSFDFQFFFFFFFKILLIFIWALLYCWPRSFLSLFEEENKKAIPGLSSSHVSISRKKNIPRRSLSTVFSFPTLLIRWPNKNKQTKLKKKNFVFGPNDVAALTHGGGGGHIMEASILIFHLNFYLVFCFFCFFFLNQR